MPSIIIQDLPPRNQYVASPTMQSVFIYNFPIFEPTDLLVFQYPAGGVPDDLTQQLTYLVDYTVAGMNLPNGGTITLVVPANVGDIITIVRAMSDERLNYYIDTAITADALNTDFESEVMMIQQNTMYNQDITPHYNLDAQIVPYVDTILPILPASSVWIKNAGNTAITTATLPAFPVGTSVDGVGTFQHITRWAGPQLLEDSSVILDDSGNITNANSIVAGHVYVSGQTVTTNSGDLILSSFTGSVDVTSILNLNLRTPLRWYDTANSNYVAFQAPSTLSGNTTWNLPAQDGSTGYALITDGAGNLSFGPVSEPTTTGVAVPIAQPGHRFTVGQIVIYNGANYVLAQADNSVDCEVIGIVSEVIDANNFQLLTEGFVSGLSDLTSGDTYFLSDVTPGLLTLTEPVTAMHISKPLFIAQSATTGYFHNWRGKVIPTGSGGGDASTVTYEPATPGNWPTPPAFVAPALDDLAATGVLGPFSAGSVIYSDGTKLTQDNANFNWNDSTGTFHVLQPSSVLTLNNVVTITSDPSGSHGHGNHLCIDGNPEGGGTIFRTDQTGTNASWIQMTGGDHTCTGGGTIYVNGNVSTESGAEGCVQTTFGLSTSSFQMYDYTQSTLLFQLDNSGVLQLPLLTASSALATDASHNIVASSTTATELGYVHGVTSSIQAQINALSGGGLTWNVVTSSQAMVANNGYFVNSGSLVTLTLPATMAVGDTFQVVGMNTGGWTIAQNSGQQIRYSTHLTTSGAGGSVSSTSEGDAINLVCNVANTNLIATPGVIGTLTIV